MQLNYILLISFALVCFLEFTVHGRADKVMTYTNIVKKRLKTYQFGVENIETREMLKKYPNLLSEFAIPKKLHNEALTKTEIAKVERIEAIEAGKAAEIESKAAEITRIKALDASNTDIKEAKEAKEANAKKETKTRLASTLGSDQIRVVTTWMIIPRSGTFQVEVEYNVLGARYLIVDIVSAQGSIWYGKGFALIPKQGTGTVSVQCLIEIAGLEKDTEVTRSAWIVSQDIYEQYLTQMKLPENERNKNSTRPWDYAIDKDQGYGKAFAPKAYIAGYGVAISSIALSLINFINP